MRWGVEAALARAVIVLDEVLRPVQPPALLPWARSFRPTALDRLYMSCYTSSARSYRSTLATLLALSTWSDRGRLAFAMLLPQRSYRASEGMVVRGPRAPRHQQATTMRPWQPRYGGACCHRVSVSPPAGGTDTGGERFLRAGAPVARRVERLVRGGDSPPGDVSSVTSSDSGRKSSSEAAAPGTGMHIEHATVTTWVTV